MNGNVVAVKLFFNLANIKRSSALCFLQRFRLQLIAVAGLMLLASCSFKTFYNNLDIFIPEYIEGLVTLDDALEQELDQRVSVLLDWHRKTQLQQYAQWLRESQRLVNDDASYDQLEAQALALEGFWATIVEQFDADMIAILVQLDAEQQQELFSSLQTRNSEFEAEFVNLDDEERKEQYHERISDIAETWLGDLTESQSGLIEGAVTMLRSSAGRRLQLRKDWQQGIQKILAANASVPKKKEQLRAFIQHNRSNTDAVISEVMDHNRGVLIRLILAMKPLLTAEQKQHFISESNDYIRMFDELSGQQ